MSRGATDPGTPVKPPATLLRTATNLLTTEPQFVCQELAAALQDLAWPSHPVYSPLSVDASFTVSYDYCTVKLST